MTVQTISFRNGDMRVIRAGKGPVLGYLHGTIGNPSEHAFLEELAKKHEVVAPCLPGFSGSTTDPSLRDLQDWVFLLSEVIDLVGLTGKPVVASSLNAMLALELAAIRPEAFSELVLLSPLGLWDNDAPLADLYATRTTKQAEILLQDPAKGAAYFETDPALSKDEQFQAGVDRYLTSRAAASIVWPFPAKGLEDRIHRVSCPVTIVWGDSDQLVPASYAALYDKALSGRVKKTVHISEAGHLVEWDQAEKTAQAVEKAL